MGHKTDCRERFDHRPKKEANVVRQIIAGAYGLEDRGVVHASVERDSRWERLSAKYLAAHNHCEFCGVKLAIQNGRRNLEVHHVIPYHLRPDLELVESNWIALCREPHDCHRLIAHFGDFKLYNPLLREFISVWQFVVRLAKSMLKIARGGKGR